MHRLVAFTGAGISKASGIPTFDEMGDIRDKLSRGFFNNYPEEFYKIAFELKRLSEKALPNPAHIALAKHNIPVVTMNVDGLHRRAGSKDVLEVHGNLDFVFCDSCGGRFDFNVVGDSVFCPRCNQVLQPNVVLYGDAIPLYLNALDLMADAEELLVIGTSFYTSTAFDLVGRCQRAGIRVTTINSNAERRVPELVKEIFES